MDKCEIHRELKEINEKLGTLVTQNAVNKTRLDVHRNQLYGLWTMVISGLAYTAKQWFDSLTKH